MHFFRHLNQNSAIRNVVMILAAIAIGTAAASVALAADHGGARGAAHMRGNFGGPPSNPLPSTPPIFNPSSPNTMPQAPETPVSPASPGSVFGNG
jgi:hypothetical protein